ncbi:MAG TPA: TadE family protein [Candidatus Obscuribacterales bacterium]
MSTRRWKKSGRNKQSGQAAVEFALAVPLLMLVIVAVLYFGRYFLIAQTILHAAQEGVKIAAATPIDSSNASTFQSTMNVLRGFGSPQGGSPDPQSTIYSSLAAANLLSQGSSGDLPSGASVKILPWDDPSQTLPQGTIAVQISYPFKFLSGPFGSGAMDTVAVSLPVYQQTSPLLFFNFLVSQKAVAASSVYQN